MTELEPSANDGSTGATGTAGLAEFEAALGELESIVAALESGEVDLEQALTKFERGVALTRQCQQTLNSAALRVDQLLGVDDPAAQPEVGAFEAAAEDEPGADTTGQS